MAPCSCPGTHLQQSLPGYSALPQKSGLSRRAAWYSAMASGQSPRNSSQRAAQSSRAFPHNTGQSAGPPDIPQWLRAIAPAFLTAQFPDYCALPQNSDPTAAPYGTPRERPEDGQAPGQQHSQIIVGHPTFRIAQDRLAIEGLVIRYRYGFVAKSARQGPELSPRRRRRWPLFPR